MNAWLEYGLSNGVAATLLALVAALATRWCRRPQVVLVLWLLVLAKLLAPPIVGLPGISLRAYLPGPAGDGEPPAHEFVVPQSEPSPSVRELAALDELSEPPALSPEWNLPLELPIEAYLPADPIDDHAAPEISWDPAFAEVLPPPVDIPLAAEQCTPRALAVQSPSLMEWLPRAILYTWIGGSTLWFIVAALRMLRFARLLRRAEPARSALQAEVRVLSEQMGLARAPAVCVTRRRVPPLVWCICGRPTILLPAELLENLSDEQRATLLAHELAHVARRDHVLRWFELLSIGLYWWHPVAWWARTNAEAAQEQCCDQRVVALLPHAARAYAETLLATIEFLAEPGRGVPLGASAFSQVGQMHRRLTMILKRNTARRMTWPAATALAAIGLLVLPLSLHTLWAEPPAEQDTEAAAEAALDEAASEPQVEQIEILIEPAEPTVVHEEIEVEIEPAVAVSVEFEQDEEERAEEPDDSTPQKASTIERRLERLERMIEELVGAQHQADAAKPAAPKMAKSRSADKTAKWALDVRKLEDIEQQSQLMLADAEKTAIEQIRRVESARQRVREANEKTELLRHEVDHVKELLEALRNRFVAKLEYAQSAASLLGLYRSRMRDYAVTSAGLAAAEQGRRDTKLLLEELRKRGAQNEQLEEIERQHKSFEESVKRFAAGIERWNSQASAEASLRGAGQKFTVAIGSDAERVKAAIANDREREQRIAAAAHAAKDAKNRGEASVDEELNILTDRELEMQSKLKEVEQIGDVMKAHIDARMKEIEAMERNYRSQHEQAKSELLKIQAKRADILRGLEHVKRAGQDAAGDKVRQEAHEKQKQLETNVKDGKQGAQGSVFREWELGKAMSIPVGKRRKEAARDELNAPDGSDSTLLNDRQWSPFVALSQSNKRLADAKDRWQVVRHVYSSAGDGVESQEEAAVREEYYRIKQEAKQVFEQVLRDAVDVERRF